MACKSAGGLPRYFVVRCLPLGGGVTTAACYVLLPLLRLLAPPLPLANREERADAFAPSFLEPIVPPLLQARAAVPWPASLHDGNNVQTANLAASTKKRQNASLRFAGLVLEVVEP